MTAPAAASSDTQASGPSGRHDRPVLVTGAAGFLGSHLCDRLVESGAVVIGLDNLSTGHLTHLAGLRGHARFHFERHDVTEPLPQALREAGAVYNLACPASPAYYQRHPIDTLLASTLGSWRVLELATAGRARVLQASTSEVYGDPEQHPQHEDYWGNVNPIGPRSCYDEGKRCAETLFFDYHRQHGLDIKVARIFNTYGPRMHPNDGRVVSNFIVQALKGEEITLYGDGQQTRSFCYVDDLIDAFLAFMDAPKELTGPINLGNPNEFTIRELAAEGMTCILVTHEMKFARDVSSHVIYLHKGVIEEEGPPQQVFGAPKSARLDRLLRDIGGFVGRAPRPNMEGLERTERAWRRFGGPPLREFALIDALERKLPPRTLPGALFTQDGGEKNQSRQDAGGPNFVVIGAVVAALAAAGVAGWALTRTPQASEAAKVEEIAPGPIEGVWVNQGQSCDYKMRFMIDGGALVIAPGAGDAIRENIVSRVDGVETASGTYLRRGETLVLRALDGTETVFQSCPP